MELDQSPVALVTGSTAGLGLHIASALVRKGYRVVIVGRDAERLEIARRQIESSPSKTLTNGSVTGHLADVTDPQSVGELFASMAHQFPRLDVLVNTVGASDRGLIENLSVSRLEQLITQNVVSVLLCSQAAIAPLEKTGGVIVNIGSLASKVGARYIGGYAIAKHALAGLTAQMRLELKPRGVHVALVSPGPIRRDDAGTRYEQNLDPGLPEQAAKPGGGARLKGLPPELVADAVVRCIHRRSPDVVLPGYLRPLIAIGHAMPRIGDWLLLKFTSSKQP
ncbi:SDR family NAD(P)-dependent oxidoreductase [Rubripirellula reticaptiva]|uniref:D-beta-hydroxybutyrate dehydrogenase n=1 Tax=Rubripirellula reticaptiva TaxID=2528013 RepID=A0A5C6FA32_9BACT|nr:SDR family oxidoreductase [Rubripirellula reticaptiva]TWU57390.1 D-beta-hydroxybutyrate dehydrogenase [Rubripirellula reticaptiva]